MSQDKPSSRYRNCCWTYNNPTPEGVEHLRAQLDQFSYIVWGHEVGSSGTPHLQGYCEFAKQPTFSAVKKILGNTVHFAQRKGKPKQAAGYCKKGLCEHHIRACDICEYCESFDGDYEFFFPRTVDEPQTWIDPFEYGTISEQGKRTDITDCVEMIQDGCTMRQVAQHNPEAYVKFHRGFRDLRATLMPERSLKEMPHVIVLWGETGTGKTRDAIIKYWPDEPHYIWRPSNTSWWDGYDGQTKIIMDEFRGQMPFADLLGLLDRNEYRAPIKGGFIQIQADKFILTSPKHPSLWYDDDKFDKLAQLKRRITECIEMGTVQQWSCLG